LTFKALHELDAHVLNEHELSSSLKNRGEQPLGHSSAARGSLADVRTFHLTTPLQLTLRKDNAMRTKAITMFLLLNLLTATVFASSVSAKPTHGGMSEVEIHNHTNWAVDVFVDGDFVGTLRPHSHMTVPTESGYTRLFARADCSCGTSVTWNSTYYFYPGYSYPWILTS
jgi:hypothetical protein